MIVNIQQIQNLSNILDSKFTTSDFSTLFINNDKISYSYDQFTKKISTSIVSTIFNSITTNSDSTSITDFTTTYYPNGNEYQEGDLILFTNFGDGYHLYVHNENNNGDQTDFTEISNNIDTNFVRQKISGIYPIEYNSTSGEISLDTTQVIQNQNGIIQTADFKISGTGYLGESLQINTTNNTAKINVLAQNEYIYFGDTVKNLTIDTNQSFVMTFSGNSVMFLDVETVKTVLRGNPSLELIGSNIKNLSSHIHNFHTGIEKSTESIITSTNTIGSQRVEMVKYLQTVDTNIQTILTYSIANLTTASFKINLTCKKSTGESYLTLYEGIAYYDSSNTDYRFVPSPTETKYYNDLTSISPSISIIGSDITVKVKSNLNVTFKWIVNIDVLEISL